MKISGDKMKTQKMKENCIMVSNILKTIAHPERLMIFCYLREKEMTGSDLLECCNISQSQLSQFLGRMQREGLLSVRKEGNFSFYKIKDPRIIKLIDSLQKVFCD